MQVNVDIELTRLKVSFTSSGENSTRIECPFHDDSTPSLDVYHDSGKFHCHACKKAGDFATLAARIEGKPRYIVEAELAARYGDDEKTVDAEHIDRFHRDLFCCDRLMQSLKKRMINDETIRFRRIGRDGDKITIPIPGPSGATVNVRRYLPDADPDDKRPKMTNMRGRGKRLRLYPFDQLRFEKIVLCGGEMKALAAIQVLNKHKIGALCLTGGEKDWSTALEGFFVGKQVWVCSDVDAVGLQSTEMRCLRLSGVVTEVFALHLPLDITTYPHGDMNDYLRLYPDGSELLALINECAPFVPGALKQLEQEDETVSDMAVNAVTDPSRVNKRMRCKIAISAIDQSIYYIPRRVKVKCSRDQDLCAICPVFMSKEDEFEIKPESSAVLAMMGAPKNILAEEIRQGLHIPPCKVVTFDTVSNFKVVEARVQRSLDLTENNSDRMSVPTIVVDEHIELNETYELVGRALPHPRTQAATLIASEAVAVQDALSSYNPGDTSDLRAFQPDEWTVESIEDKLAELYTYYSHNVTRIYDRMSLHKICDLTFHSCLNMLVEGKAVKGWVETLIVGDSGHGKTEVTKGLSEYYGLGERVDCKSATVAGLSGGLEQLNGKWFAQWGVLPVHDRRLVILEELKGMRPEVFAKLTDVRSSGTAEIAKIHRSKARARTRIIAVSNPPKANTVMSAYAFGVRAITELIPNPEDVRRFDACFILNKNDIDINTPNTSRPQLPELFEQDKARRLVLWAWTREMEQVEIPHSTYACAVARIEDMCARYTDNVPILDRGSGRFKLLRLAVACAVRTFSSDDGTSLIVRPCHVDWVADMLETEYKSASHGYLEYSRSITVEPPPLPLTATAKTVEQRVIDIIGLTPNPQGIIGHLLRSYDLDAQDFQDWCGWTYDEAQLFIGQMVRIGALLREPTGKFYAKTPRLIDALRMLSAGEVKLNLPLPMEPPQIEY